MPLNCQHETIVARIFDRFNHAIGGPCGRNQIRADGFNCLMMVAVDQGVGDATYLRQLAVLRDLHSVRRPFAWHSLFVLDRPVHLRSDVLDQCSPARNVEDLHAEADRKQRNVFPFDGVDDQQVSLILDRMNRSQCRMRLLTVDQGIDIGVAARQSDTVKTLDNCVDIVRSWNQADMHRRTAGGFDCFTVVTREIESVGGVFNAHRDPDAWSFLHI